LHHKNQNKRNRSLNYIMICLPHKRTLEFHWILLNFLVFIANQQSKSSPGASPNIWHYTNVFCSPSFCFHTKFNAFSVFFTVTAHLLFGFTQSLMHSVFFYCDSEVTQTTHHSNSGNYSNFLLPSTATFMFFWLNTRFNAFHF